MYNPYQEITQKVQNLALQNQPFANQNIGPRNSYDQTHGSYSQHNQAGEMQMPAAADSQGIYMSTSQGYAMRYHEQMQPLSNQHPYARQEQFSSGAKEVMNANASQNADNFQTRNAYEMPKMYQNASQIYASEASHSNLQPAFQSNAIYASDTNSMHQPARLPSQSYAYDDQSVRHPIQMQPHPESSIPNYKIPDAMQSQSNFGQLPPTASYNGPGIENQPKELQRSAVYSNLAAQPNFQQENVYNYQQGIIQQPRSSAIMNPAMPSEVIQREQRVPSENQGLQLKPQKNATLSKQEVYRPLALQQFQSEVPHQNKSIYFDNMQNPSANVSVNKSFPDTSYRPVEEQKVYKNPPTQNQPLRGGPAVGNIETKVFNRNIEVNSNQIDSSNAYPLRNLQYPPNSSSSFATDNQASIPKNEAVSSRYHSQVPPNNQLKQEAFRSQNFYSPAPSSIRQPTPPANTNTVANAPFQNQTSTIGERGQNYEGYQTKTHSFAHSGSTIPPQPWNITPQGPAYYNNTRQPRASYSPNSMPNYPANSIEPASQSQQYRSPMPQQRLAQTANPSVAYPAIYGIQQPGTPRPRAEEAVSAQPQFGIDQRHAQGLRNDYQRSQALPLSNRVSQFPQEQPMQQNEELQRQNQENMDYGVYRARVGSFDKEGQRVLTRTSSISSETSYELASNQPQISQQRQNVSRSFSEEPSMYNRQSSYQSNQFVSNQNTIKDPRQPMPNAGQPGQPMVNSNQRRAADANQYAGPIRGQPMSNQAGQPMLHQGRIPGQPVAQQAGIPGQGMAKHAGIPGQPMAQHGSIPGQPIVIMPGSNTARPVHANFEPRLQHILENMQNKQGPIYAKLRKIAEDALDIQNETMNFNGRRGDREYIMIEELLTRLLLALDNVDAAGFEDIRLTRKSIVRQVIGLLSILERRAKT